MPENNERLWYAIWVRSKSEKRTSLAFRGKGYEEFLPLYRSKRRWSDRIKEIDLPLFPGYLFCRFSMTDRLVPILTTPGVISIVGTPSGPTPIPDEEISAVQAVVRSGLGTEPWPFPEAGTRVFFDRGPLAGITGTVTGTNGKQRLVVSVTLLQRSVAVEIDREWARPLPATDSWDCSAARPNVRLRAAVGHGFSDVHVDAHSGSTLFIGGQSSKNVSLPDASVLVLQFGEEYASKRPLCNWNSPETIRETREQGIRVGNYQNAHKTTYLAHHPALNICSRNARSTTFADVPRATMWNCEITDSIRRPSQGTYDIGVQGISLAADLTAT